MSEAPRPGPESPPAVERPGAPPAENWRKWARVRERWQPVMWLWLKRLTVSLLLLALAAAVGVVGVVRYYEANLPSVAELKRGYAPPQVTRVLARDGTLLSSLFTERRTVIPLSDVPNAAKLAFLAAEDASFYEHEGLNYLGMLRALWVNLRAGRTVQGGSTITQQVVKNLLLDSERTYRRKIRETILARRLEQHLSKDEIFGLYINHIYLGHGRYGIEEAARFYFGKRAKELELAEAATLAGLIASPERFSPRNDAERSAKRRRYVLEQMRNKGFVEESLFQEVIELPVHLAPSEEAESELAPEVVQLVRRMLEATVGERAKLGGYTVTTTLDPALQVEARRVVRENLDKYLARQKLAPPFTLAERRLWGPAFLGTPRAHQICVGKVVALDDDAGTIEVQVGDTRGRVNLAKEERFNPKRLRPSEFVTVGAALRVGVLEAPGSDGPVALRLELGPQAALAAVDPKTREVRALVGSYEALAGGLDRATRARRQPGSSFKPFVYGYALQSRRVTAATVLTLPASRDGKLAERRMSVREALARSDNAAAEQLLAQVGAANVVEHSRAVGIDSKLEPNLSLALGAYEVRPLEIANAYATFASGGTFAPPVLVTRIVGPDGKDVELPSRPPSRRVLQDDEAYLITSLMRSVVTDGTAKRALVLGRPVAGKTGTTNGAKDAWFVGYSTDLVASVWVGYDDALPLGWGESGGVTALPAWVDFMKVAHGKRPATDFVRPAGVVRVRIDRGTGLLARPGQEDALEEEFLAGTEPAEMAEEDAGVLDGDDAGALGPDAAAPESPPLGEDLELVGSAPDAGASVDSLEPQSLPPAPIEELPPF